MERSQAGILEPRRASATRLAWSACVTAARSRMDPPDESRPLTPLTPPGR